MVQPVQYRLGHDRSARAQEMSMRPQRRRRQKATLRSQGTAVIRTSKSTPPGGWYWGSEQFREYLLKKVDAAAIRRNRNYQSAQMGRDHGQAEAEKIVQQGV